MTTRSFLSTRSLRWYAICGLAGATLALAGTGAQAAIVSYVGSDPGAGSTDPKPNSTTAAADFDPNAGAVNPVNYISFESAPVGGFTSLDLGSGVTVTGTDYQGNGQSIQDAAQGSPDSLFGYNTTYLGSNFLYINGGFATFTFSSPISAFGAFFTGVQLDGETVTFNDGTAEALDLPNPSSTSGGAVFLGFTDSGALISSVTIDTRNPSNTSGDFIGVDDVRFSFAPVPEPSTVALLAGATALGAAAWRQARRIRGV